ncbi:hypothetical protein Goshw_020522 [Gossypium schwendimanii]|uniref:1,4-alpha-D-glucan glucanohydrolase n=1 Tax=Gossypium schwendimanii TaxID=34291 RepID=A0A7J9LB20_GOSSC|nr:hypothetical protein [Gossypium schwendimanii]
MATLAFGSLLQNPRLSSSRGQKLLLNLKPLPSLDLDCSPHRKLLCSRGACFSNSNPCGKFHIVKASSTDTAPIDTFSSADVLYEQTFPVNRIEKKHRPFYFRSAITAGEMGQEADLLTGALLTDCEAETILITSGDNHFVESRNGAIPKLDPPDSTLLCELCWILEFPQPPSIVQAWSTIPENHCHQTLDTQASLASQMLISQASDSLDARYSHQLRVEGKLLIRLDQSKDQLNWRLTIGCSLSGKWILHWGVSYVGDTGSGDLRDPKSSTIKKACIKFCSEWDQPPKDMWPYGSIPIKDYAIETPFKKLSKDDTFHEVKIDFNPSSAIEAIHFILKDEETGASYQHKGRDFRVSLVNYLEDDGNMIQAKSSFGKWPDAVEQLPNMVLKAEASCDSKNENRRLEGFYEEQLIVKEVSVGNMVNVAIRKFPDAANIVLHLETDIPGDVVVHWGVCRDDAKTWEIPAVPYPPETTVFRNKALRTLLQPTGNGSRALFTLDEKLDGFLFVLKLDANSWVNFQGNDFYIPLSSARSVKGQSDSESEETSGKAHTDGIINEIRNLVSGLNSEKSLQTKVKEAKESILNEIEKLAAEAYSIFRSSTPSYPEEDSDADDAEPTINISSGTGSGFEILCQGFNWESNKSGRWYMELKEKASEISSLGFTVIWLPPPTESVSPEGYMPKDLYNLNSRYGTIDELKDLVKSLHGVGLKVLGDVVLNHRCAHYQNQNGVWNIFGGRLNWDDRAVVGDDPHFQGRGNKSSGDNFHAAPNIDHSQDFVRKDLIEWLCWLRLKRGSLFLPLSIMPERIRKALL